MMKTDFGKFFVTAIIGISMIFLFPGNSPATETILVINLAVAKHY